MPCIYILYSDKTNRYYVGSSRDATADIRLSAHNKGKTKSTKHGRPWKLVHQEPFASYTEARRRELFLKTGVGRAWIHQHVSSQS